MIGGVTRLGGLPGLPGRVTRLAGVAFCHVNDSRWGNPPSRGRVHVTFASAQNLNQNNMAVNCLWRRLCIIKSDSKTPKHWNAAAIFNVYMPNDHATMSSKVTPGTRGCKFACKFRKFVSFAGHFSTTARRVTSPTWGPPPPCKQALSHSLLDF